MKKKAFKELDGACGVGEVTFAGKLKQQAACSDSKPATAKHHKDAR